MTMRVSTLGLGGLALLAAGAAQAQPGPEISRNFDVGSFNKLQVSGAYEVTVTTGRPVAVTARGTQRLVERIVVEVKDGTLVIRPKDGGWRQSWGIGRSWARISVSVPSLSAVGLAGSGNTSVDRIAGERFNGTVAGSGDLAIGQLAVRELRLGLTGSGGVKAAGRVDKASYNVTGSGDLDATGVTAATASTAVAGSGSIRARVTGEASAAVMGSGDIDITGGARCQQSRQGSGRIRCS